MVRLMWEEHPAYQKAQAMVIGLLLLVLFIGSVIYCVSNHDWDLLRMVLYAGGSLLVVLALLALFTRVVVKALALFQRNRDKPGTENEA